MIKIKTKEELIKINAYNSDGDWFIDKRANDDYMNDTRKSFNADEVGILWKHLVGTEMKEDDFLEYFGYMENADWIKSELSKRIRKC